MRRRIEAPCKPWFYGSHFGERLLERDADQNGRTGEEEGDLMKLVFAIAAVFALAFATTVSTSGVAHAGCPTHNPNCGS